MRRIAAILVIIGWLAVLPAAAGEAERYGEGVSIEEAVPVSALLSSPDDYLGKKVRVDGVITGVCQKRGCWMQVTDPETGNGVRIKVEDGVIVFPYTAMGKKASAEGVFEAIALTPEQVEARAQAQKAAEAGHEHAEGESCDRAQPKKDGSGEGAGCDAPVQDNRIFMIHGTGAVIYS
ncbi:MAG TPA: DUF4920 domain-containing protein [Candidatus Sulfomarinibacteraceae bacterium]|nr:DUF4920 domain-containing protein [Candidatus Sulfomarinibacteraceae bacterium]